MRKQIIFLAATLLMSIFLSACSISSIDSLAVGNTEFSQSTSLTAAQTTEQPSSEPQLSSGSADSGQKAISAIDLYNEFKADVSSATSKYTGKNIVASGIVVRTGPDIHGTPSIELSDTEDGKVYVLYVVNSFHQLDEVSVGEKVTMKGNFHIFSSGDWGVVLKQGEIIEKG